MGNCCGSPKDSRRRDGAGGKYARQRTADGTAQPGGPPATPAFTLNRQEGTASRCVYADARWSACLTATLAGWALSRECGGAYSLYALTSCQLSMTCLLLRPAPQASATLCNDDSIRHSTSASIPPF